MASDDSCDEFCGIESQRGNGTIDPDQECDGDGFGTCISNICRSDCGCVQPIFRMNGESAWSQSIAAGDKWLLKFVIN